MAEEADVSSDTTYGVGVVELTGSAAEEMFDQVTRQAMGLSSAEFLERWDRGEYEDIDFDTIPGLVEVWMYLPFVR